MVGGAASYIALAASRFVQSQHLISVVGDDFPQRFLDTLASRGVQQEGLQIKNGEKSFFWQGKYHYDLNTRDTLVTELNVLADFEPKVPAMAQQAEFVMLGNLAPAVQLAVLDQLQERPKLIVLDTMNFWMDVALEDLKRVIARVDVLTINDEEARQLSGEQSLVRAAKKILKSGPETLVIKKGEHGALLFQGDQVFYAPAFPLENVVDPTGAGDTFAGGFIGHLAASGDTSFENMKRAVIFGSALASLTCEAFGTKRLLEVDQQAFDARVQTLVDLVSFSFDVEGVLV